MNDDPVDDAARIVAEPPAAPGGTDWVDQVRAQGGIAKLAQRIDDLEQAVASLIGGAPTGDWHTQTLRSVILHRVRPLIDATDIPVVGVDVISMFLDTKDGLNPGPVLVIWARGVAPAGPDSTLLSWHALPGWTPPDHDTGIMPGLVSIVRKMAEDLRNGRANQLRTSAPGVINHRDTTHWAR